MSKVIKLGVREQLVARAGHAIVSVDFDSFELRTWAQCCLWILKYSELANILNNPKRCPHVEMGTYLRNQLGTGDWATKYAWGYGLKGKERLKVRGLAKGPNFGLPGGMGAARLQDYCYSNYAEELTLEQAQLACRVWREIYPEAQPYLDWVSEQVGKKRGSRSTIEQFVSKRLRGDVGFTDASNGYFQGLAADAAKAAGWALWKEAYVNKASPLYGCRPLAFIHDEHIFEIPLDRLHEAAYHMAKVQQAAAQAYCPDVAITCGPAAMYRWSKAGGDAVHNASGELICFEEAPGYTGAPPPACNLANWERRKAA
jgi:hypothetical protein